MTRSHVVSLAVAAIVVARSAVLVFWPQSQFDSDQAVIGLMAKHLAEGRALPVFMYGQTYTLGVQAWMAAPLFLLFGVSVTALKFPLLIINVIVAVLLVRLFEKEVGLRPSLAAVAAAPFILPSPGTAARLLEASGGNLEPFLYALLLWLARRRPWVCGLIVGFGFLHREFTLYAFIALICIWAAEGSLLTREGMWRVGRVAIAAAGVWLAIQGLGRFSSAAGPGTTTADLATSLAGNNLLELAHRLCLDARAIASGIGRLFTSHWPELFGLEPQPLTDFGIESTVRQGAANSAWLLIPAIGIPLARIVQAIARRSGERPASNFCAYLVLVAGFSLAGYVAGRCGAIDFYTMRYELLSILGAAGLSAWYLRVERSRMLLGIWAACSVAIVAMSLTTHLRLLAEYVTHAPVAPKQELVRALDARHIRYGYADFWVAYYVSFMSRERIILASDDLVKVRTHNRLVDAHRDEAIRVSRRPCAGGEQLTPAFWACRP